MRKGGVVFFRSDGPRLVGLDRRAVTAVVVEVERRVESARSDFEEDALAFEVQTDPEDLSVAFDARDFLESRVDAICRSLH